MSRWRSKSSSSDEGLNTDSPMVVLGTIRSRDETDVLSVRISILSSEISMHAGESELGRWDTASVEIRPIDATSFEFIVEGDRLVFLPEDPAAFGLIPFGEEGDSSARGRKARKAKRTKTPSDEVRGTPAPVRSSIEPQPRPKKPAKPKKAPKAKKPAKVKKPRKARQPANVDPKEPNAKRTGVWIRTLDTARRHDFLGLDRVPVDVGLRGGDHEHTWDHRVAASSGAGKHVCMLCGRIRF